MMKLFGRKKSSEFQEAAASAEESAAKVGTSLFERMKQAVSRTRESFAGKIEEIVARTRSVDEQTLQTLEAVLLSGDIGLPTTNAVLDVVRERARRGEIDGEALRDLLKEELRKILDAPNAEAKKADAASESTPDSTSKSTPDSTPDSKPNSTLNEPHVVFLVGVNGTGKTTTSGKLAAWHRAHGSSVLLCAADTFRAAAIEQLEVWANRSQVELIKTRQGGDPAAVLYDAISAAKVRGIDLLLVDTAGRLHTKTGLMDELEKMRRTAARLIPGAPHEVLLVMDATTGQNGLQQARLFSQSAGVTGIVLTKLDGTAKGGIAIAIAREMNLPVCYVGIGEKMEDLLEFDSTAFVDSLLS